MSATPAIAGVSDHNGWAVLVTVALRSGTPDVIDRRRVELIDDALPSQPYHHESLELPLDEATALVDSVTRAVTAHATGALEKLRADLAPDHALVAIAIREGPTPPIPERLADVLKSRRATFAADGEMYRRALCEGAAAQGIAVATHARGKSLSGATKVLGTDEVGAETLIAELGRALGPPWRKDHRNASAAAIGALPAYVPGARVG